MRSRFDEQLTKLNNSLIEMGAMVESAIGRATTALLERDADVAQSILGGDNIIDEKEKEIEALCLKLILNQQPVARDLRLISTALKMITDIERIGDHAADISELCLTLLGLGRFDLPQHIPQMARATINMVTDSIDAYVNKDLDMARSVIEQDDIVDELFVCVKKDMIALIQEGADKGEIAFDLMQIAKYYERIGDHAANIAEWVIFSLTGVHKNMQLL